MSPRASTPTALPCSLDRLPSIDELLRMFPTQEACVDFLLALQGRAGHVCRRCGSCRWSRRSRKEFFCRRCGRSYRPTAGTLFERTKIDLRLWMIALLLACQSRRLLSGRFLADFLGISNEAALLMRDKIWDRMGAIADPGILGGPGVPVEIDETLINRHVRRRSSAARLSLFGITDRRTYRVFVVTDRRRATLLPIIRRHVAPGSIINTDGFAAYRTLGSEGFAHVACNHSKGFFVGFDGATTTAIDGYWGELKKTLAGVHRGISEARLDAFLNAHACRYSFRDRPETLFWKLLGGTPTRAMMPDATAVPAGFKRAHAPRGAANGYPELHHLFTCERTAAQHLGALALSRSPGCPACRAPEGLYLALSGQRLICRQCGAKQSIRNGTVFSQSKIPLRTWFSLIWLVTLGHSGVSITFASAYLNVSKAAASTMLTRLREAIAAALHSRRIGGAGQVVDLALYKLRVRPPAGHPRRRHRHVIVASDAKAWTCGVLPKASARYVHLWVKKKILAGSVVRHPEGRAFAEVGDADVQSRPVSEEETLTLACRGHITGAKTALRTFHTIVDYDKALLFLKEREFKAQLKGEGFSQTLARLAFSVSPQAAPR